MSQKYGTKRKLWQILKRKLRAKCFNNFHLASNAEEHIERKSFSSNIEVDCPEKKWEK